MPAKLTPPVSKSDHLLGSPDALMELVEYGDYQCPHCGLAHPMVKNIRKTFGKKLRFVFRHFPLSNVHEYALPAALAAEAAGKQQRFWEMHDMIYEHQHQLNGYALLDFALELRLNIPFSRWISRIQYSPKKSSAILKAECGVGLMEHLPFS